jgi:hypothetical protein
MLLVVQALLILEAHFGRMTWAGERWLGVWTGQMEAGYSRKESAGMIGIITEHSLEGLTTKSRFQMSLLSGRPVLVRMSFVQTWRRFEDDSC